MILDCGFRIAFMLKCQHIRIGKNGANFFSNDAGLSNGRLFIGIQFAEHHHELITAETRDSIHLTNAAANAACHFLQ